MNYVEIFAEKWEVAIVSLEKQRNAYNGIQSVSTPLKKTLYFACRGHTLLAKSSVGSWFISGW